MGKSTISMAIFHCYVSSPKGKPPFSYGFPIKTSIFLWFSYGFPIQTSIFLWFSYGFPIKTSIFLWFSYGFPIQTSIFLWFSYGFPIQTVISQRPQDRAARRHRAHLRRGLRAPHPHLPGEWLAERCRAQRGGWQNAVARHGAPVGCVGDLLHCCTHYLPSGKLT